MAAEPTPVRLVLASASPRRRDLLGHFGVPFEVRVPDIDESVIDGESPVPYVRRLAAAKALAVVAADDELVVAADTTVDLGGRILGKPDDDADAAAMLRSLSGRTHRVHTGVAVRLGDRRAVDVVSTSVTMATLTDELIAWYIATGEPLDKAGAYALQGVGGVLVHMVRGNVSNVVGLPLPTLVRLCHEVGVSLTDQPGGGQAGLPAESPGITVAIST